MKPSHAELHQELQVLHHQLRIENERHTKRVTDLMDQISTKMTQISTQEE